MDLSLINGQFCRSLMLAGACGWMLSFAGCGGSSEKVSKGDSAAKDSKPKPENDDTSPSKATASKAESKTDGPRMVDGIPFDVFFDKPLTVAANTQTGAASNTTVAANDTSKGTTGSETTTQPKDPPKAKSGSLSIKDIFDKDSLDNEIKTVRNYLASKTASVSVYNSGLLEIAPEAATLSVLAVAVSRHPDDFSWKKNAKYVRDLAWKIGEITISKDGKTKNSFDDVSDAFAKIDDILKGTDPAGLPEADPDKDFGDAIGGNLVILMRRIKKSEEILKSTVSSEAGLKNEAAKAAQEGALLAFLGAILTSPGFGWDGDEEFAGYAKPLVDGGKQIVEAAKSGNFALYDEGIIKVSKSCNECHPKFKP